MLKKSNFNFFDLLFFSLPLSIILGPSISLINIFLFISIYFFKYFSKDHLNLLLRDKFVILLFLLNIYLVFNTFISIEPSNGIYRNLGFVRFILFFIAINYFFYIKKYDLSLFKVWAIVFFVFVFDVYFERFYGSNILGYGSLDQEYGPRVISFFKDEPIAGAYLNGLLFIIAGYIFLIFKNRDKIYKIFPLIILFIFIISVLITGERSNTIKAFIGFLFFMFFLDYFKFKYKIIITLSFFAIFLIIIANSSYMKTRYISQIYNLFSTKEIKSEHDLRKIKYFKLYNSGLTVFKNYPLFGAGNKNYRIETCNKKNANKFDYFCSTHPHQIYIEFLSEHGLIGSIIILSIFFTLIFKILRKITETKNYIQIGALTYILTHFLPMIPSGAFFSDFNITFYMLNLSLMYAVSNKTNIFEKKIKGPLAQ